MSQAGERGDYLIIFEKISKYSQDLNHFSISNA